MEGVKGKALSKRMIWDKAEWWLPGGLSPRTVTIVDLCWPHTTLFLVGPYFLHNTRDFIFGTSTSVSSEIVRIVGPWFEHQWLFSPPLPLYLSVPSGSRRILIHHQPSGNPFYSHFYHFTKLPPFLAVTLSPGHFSTEQQTHWCTHWCEKDLLEN